MYKNAIPLKHFIDNYKVLHILELNNMFVDDKARFLNFDHIVQINYA